MFSAYDIMVKVPAGEIELRDDRIGKRWMVKVSSFMLGKYPVTQKQYHAIMDGNTSEFRGENLPVENVTWKEAVIFCNRLSDLQELENCYYFEENGDIKLDIAKSGFRLRRRWNGSSHARPAKRR